MTPEDLTSKLGGHVAGELGLLGLQSPETALSRESESALFPELSDEAIDRWLIASCLLGHKIGAARGCASVRALEAAGLALPSAIAKAGPLPVESALRSAEHPKAEQTAHLLVRVCRALQDRHDGSLAALARGADDLEDLAGRLLGLAAGFGRAAVLRLLRPLRETWPMADEIPLDPAARAAAVHLGWIQHGQDEDGAPGALRAFLREQRAEPGERAGTAPTQFCDIEAALERLGRAACLRERSDRCPLGADCPLAAS